MAFSFSDKLKKDKGSVLLVDGLNLAFRWKHQGKIEFTEEYYQMVTSLARSYSCDKIVIAADWGSSEYRKAIYPEYKQNRADKYAEQTEEENQKFLDFIKGYNECLEYLGTLYPVLRYKGVEADDIAAVVKLYKDDLGIENLWLISSDRDWDLLVDEGVHRFSYVTRKETKLANWHEHYEVTPDQFISLKCLQGDSGDNIKGIEGVGPKRAKDLIEAYGSAFDIYDSLPLPGRAKYIQNLNDSGDRILLNYQLMDLITYGEEAVGQENVKDILRKLSENTL